MSDMKKHIGRKVVMAKPMTKGDFHRLMSWGVPEDPDAEGCLVEYLDGGTPNHADFDNYISWSPADVFERSYKIAETFLDRIKIEKAELDGKIHCLAAFIGTPVYESLARPLQVQKDEQLKLMRMYSNSLQQAIDMVTHSGGTSEIHPAPVEFTKEELETDQILRYFHYAHLPEKLKAISEGFCRQARFLIDSLPRNPERTVALRKLLEAKDCAVRANLG